MAKKEVAFNVTLTAGEAVKQLDALQKAAKQAGDSIEKVSQSDVSPLKENIKGLNDEFKKLNPEQKAESIKKVTEGVLGSFQTIQGAFALLGKNAEAVEIAFQKAQSAFLIADGVKKVTEGIGQMGTAFKTLGNIIKANPLFTVVSVLGAITAGIAYLVSGTNKYTAEVEKNNKALEENLAIQKERITSVTKGYDREIAEARAAGKETVEIERQKLQAQIEAARQRLELLIKIRQSERKAFEEQMAEYDDLRKATKAALGVDVLEGEEEEFKKNTKKRTDEIKSLQEDLKDFTSGLNQLQFKEEADKNAKALEAYQKSQEKKLKAAKETEEQLQNEVADIRNKGIVIAQAQIEQLPNVIAEPFKLVAEETFSFIELLNGKINTSVNDLVKFLGGKFGAINDFAAQTILQNLETIGGFYDAAQSRQLAATEGNEKAQEAIRKKFFEKQKKLQVAQGLISTFEGGIQAFTSTAASPITTLFPAAPYIAAASAIAAGLANVAKIRSQQFDSSGSGGGGATSSAPSFGGLEGGNPFSVGGTLLNPQDIEAGNTLIPQEPIKVFVPATDISDAVKSNNTIQTRGEVS